MNSRTLWTRVFLGLLLLTVVAKLPSLDNPLSEDENAWAKAIYFEEWEDKFDRIPHPPLVMFGYVGLAHLGWPLKLIPVLFASLGAWLLFTVLRKQYSARTAALTAGLVVLSPLFTVGSLQLDIDGGVLVFFLALLFWLDTWEFSSKKMFFLGLISGMMLLTKYTSVFFFLPFWLKALYDARHRLRSLMDVGGAGAFALLLFSIFPLVSHFSGATYFQHTREHGAQKLLNFGLLQPEIIFLMLQALLLLGPLLLLFALLKHNWKKDIMAYAVLAFVLVFYLIIDTSTGRPLERYLAPLTVPLGILAARGIHKMKLSSWWVLGAGVVACLLLSFFTTTIIPFNNKFDYLTTGISFLIPFRGSSGPFGFYVSSLVILLGWLACVGALFLRKHKLFTPLVMLGLASLLAFNAEVLFSVTTPHVSSAGELLEEPMTGQLYAHRNFGRVYQPDAITYYDDMLFDTARFSEQLSRPATVTLLNFPPYEDPPLRSWLATECQLTGETVSRDVLIAQRYSCE